MLGFVEPLGDYETLLPHAETYKVGGLTVRTISLEHLIEVKEHVRRPKDRESLFQLKAIQQVRNEGKAG